MAAAAVKPPGPTMQPTPQKPITRSTPAPREPGESKKRSGRLGTVVRVAISLWIVWQFTCVILAAMSVPGPTSDLINLLAQRSPVRWYNDAFYLNQGHSFFAPEVGPSTIVRYELFDQSNRPIGESELPSLKDYWPRLRYHRHFMLAEQASFPSDDQNTSSYWERQYLEAYARQILRNNSKAQTVRLRRLAHYPLPRYYIDRYGIQQGYQQFKNQYGLRIDDQGYELQLEVTQRRSDLGPEPAQQAQRIQAWEGGQLETAGRWTEVPR